MEALELSLEYALKVGIPELLLEWGVWLPVEFESEKLGGGGWLLN